MPLFDDFNRNGVLVVKEDSSPLHTVVKMVEDTIDLGSLQDSAPFLKHGKSMKLITDASKEVMEHLTLYTAYAAAIANGSKRNPGIEAWVNAVDKAIAKQAEDLEKIISESE